MSALAAASSCAPRFQHRRTVHTAQVSCSAQSSSPSGGKTLGASAPRPGRRVSLLSGAGVLLSPLVARAEDDGVKVVDDVEGFGSKAGGSYIYMGLFRRPITVKSIVPISFSRVALTSWTAPGHRERD